MKSILLPVRIDMFSEVRFAYKYVQGQQVVCMDQSQAQMIDRLAIVYGKMLGF